LRGVLVERNRLNRIQVEYEIGIVFGTFGIVGRRTRRAFSCDLWLQIDDASASRLLGRGDVG
jgi:hypothetical protein